MGEGRGLRRTGEAFQASQGETVMEASWKKLRHATIQRLMWKRAERQREESRPRDAIINAFNHVSLVGG